MNMLKVLTAVLALGLLAMGCTEAPLPEDSGVWSNDLRDEMAKAIAEGSPGKVKELIELEPLVAVSPHPGTTQLPLHMAAAEGDAEIVEMLLDAGADPTAQSDEGETAYDVAQRTGAGQDVLDLLQ